MTEKLRARLRRRGAPLAAHRLGRQTWKAHHISREADRHADARAGEAIMPADRLPDRSANQRREERADIDADIENRIGAVATGVGRRIKLPDLDGDVRLEAAAAQRDAKQRDQKTGDRKPS